MRLTASLVCLFLLLATAGGSATDQLFETPRKYSLPGHEPKRVVTSDFNGDGAPDLAVTEFRDTYASVSVLLNDGSGCE